MLASVLVVHIPLYLFIMELNGSWKMQNKRAAVQSALQKINVLSLILFFVVCFAFFFKSQRSYLLKMDQKLRRRLNRVSVFWNYLLLQVLRRLMYTHSICLDLCMHSFRLVQHVFVWYKQSGMKDLLLSFFKLDSL